MSDGEVLVIFVTPEGEGTARNTAEWRKIMERRGMQKKGNEET